MPSRATLSAAACGVAALAACLASTACGQFLDSQNVASRSPAMVLLFGATEVQYRRTHSRWLGRQESEQLYYFVDSPFPSQSGLAFLAVVSSGVPLAILAIFVNLWPRAVRQLASNKTALQLCLTLQLMNFGLPVIAILIVVAGEGFDSTVLIGGVIALIYGMVNLLAVRMWRDVLVRITATRPAILFV